jgi:hypothetical protein
VGRSSLADLSTTVPSERRGALHCRQTRLRRSVAIHFADADDRTAASTEDRQALGVSRRASGT